MKFENDTLKRMKKNKTFNYRYAKYYDRLSDEFEGSYELEDYKSLKKYKRRGFRLRDCMIYWRWDCYEKNKVLDLREVNRCNNNKFCPNCRKLDLCKFIYKFQGPNEKFLKMGYIPFLLTLTVPNCSPTDLNETINILNRNFSRFYRGFGETNSNNSIKFRELNFFAAIKVLEITYNKKENTFHPHFHCVVYLSSDLVDNDFFTKNIKGHYSKKRNTFNYHSNADIHLMKIWTMICKNIRLTYNNYVDLPDNPHELYQVDIKKMNEKGFYEVFKYCFKDSHIPNYNVFKTLENALENKRLRQGYGALYNFKCEDIEIGEIQDLNLDIEEDPQMLLVKGISKLYSDYKDYTKISRYTPHIFNEID